MRRLGRYFFNCFAAISLMLCVAVCVFWAGSYVWPQEWARGRHPWVRWAVRSAAGWVSVERHELLFFPSFSAGNLWSLRPEVGYSPGGENVTGVYVHRDAGLVRARLPGEQQPPPVAVERALPKRPWYHQTRVGVAFPVLFLATAASPALWLWRRRRVTRRQHRAGLCPVCGYDLRATPDRCPECGAVPKAQPATAE